jgi:hypothetical protein
MIPDIHGSPNVEDDMKEFQDDHRGHTIFAHASGPLSGPFVGGYSAWRIEANNNYRGVLQGATAETYPTHEAAISAATSEACRKLDDLLDGD